MLHHALPRLRWYDPTQPPRVGGLVPGAGGPTRLLAAAEAVNCHDREAGILGVLPPSLPDLVCPSPQSLGLRERMHKTVSKNCVASLARLKMDILRSGRSIFEQWYGHSRDAVAAYMSPEWDHAEACWVRPHGRTTQMSAVDRASIGPPEETAVQTPVPAIVRRRRCYRLVFRLRDTTITGNSPRSAQPPEAKRRAPPGTPRAPRAKKRKPLESFRGLR